MTHIRHPEARPRPLEPGEPRRATATDVGLARYRTYQVPKPAIAGFGCRSSSEASEARGQLRMTDQGPLCWLLLPVPDHDHLHHLVVDVGVRHRRALDEQPVALEADEARLLAADPGFVPGRFDLGDDLAIVDPIAAR